MAASPGGIEVGRVRVRVVPDTSRFATDLKVALEKAEAKTNLEISTSIDTTRLDEQARAAVEQAQLAAGDLDIKAKVDTSQVREAESAFAGATSSAQSFTSGLGAIATAVIVLGPALIPITAAVIALGAALAAPIAIAGGGLTVFGLIAGFTISETQKQLKVIDQLDTKLSGLKKGTQEYADTAAQLRTAQAALTPAQTAFAAALTKVKSAFDKIPKAIVLKPITDGLDLLATLLPLSMPILKTVSGVVTDIIGQFDKAARSQGFKDFVTAFAKQLGPDLRAFATIAGNVFQGLFGLFGAFNQQLSGSVLTSLENLTQRFQDWGQTVGQSQGFRSFVDYIKRVGPQVATALGGIAAGAIAIVTAFAPVGGTVLTIVGKLGDAISKIPADVLVTLATALVGMVAASKLLGPLGTVLGSLGLSQPEILLTVGAVAALGAGFVLLYQHSKPLQQILGDLSDFFKTQLLPQIKTAAQQVFPALKRSLKDINQSLRENKPFLETLGKALLILTTDTVIGAIGQLALAVRGVGLAFKFGVPIMKLFADISIGSFRVVVAGVTILAKAVLGAFGIIIDGAAKAFGWIPGIGDKIGRAQAAFHIFSDSVIAGLSKTGDKLKALQDQIDGIHGKTFKVTVDDLDAVKRLEALQNFRFKDKTLTVNEVERAVGPGGGIGHPLADGGSGGGASRGGDTYNIQAHDYNDFLRQQQAHRRGRSGGGVALVGGSR